MKSRASAKTVSRRVAPSFKPQESKDRRAIEVLGPAPAPIEKLRNRYRWQLLLKGKQQHRPAWSSPAMRARSCPSPRAVRLHIDVDPYSML